MHIHTSKIQTKILNTESRIFQLEEELKTIKNYLAAKYNTIVIYHNGLKRIIPLQHIVMLQSQSNYTYIYLDSGEKLLTAKTLKHWQENITSPDFIRPHASFLVNKWQIQQIDLKNHELLMAAGCKARISRSVDKELFDSFRQLK